MKSNTVLTLAITSLILTVGILILTNISSGLFQQVEGEAVLGEYNIEEILRTIVNYMIWITGILFIIFIILKLLEMRKPKNEKPLITTS